jgi:DNA-binding transcriptional ArsR family regulator
MLTAFAALADPARRQVVDLLRSGERSAGEIERVLEVNQPAASKHLKALREAGLVRVRKDAQRRLYRLDPAPLAEMDAWLAPYRAFWTDKLDALERFLDKEN